jgi:hypothetical protein
MTALGRRKRGRKIRIVGKSETKKSFDVCSKRRGSGREVTDQTENIDLSLSQH